MAAPVSSVCKDVVLSASLTNEAKKSPRKERSSINTSIRPTDQSTSPQAAPLNDRRLTRSVSFPSLSKIVVVALAIIFMILLASPVKAETSTSPFCSEIPPFRLASYGTLPSSQHSSGQSCDDYSEHEQKLNNAIAASDPINHSYTKDAHLFSMIAALGGEPKNEKWLSCLPQLTSDKVKLVNVRMGTYAGDFLKVDPKDMTSSIMSGVFTGGHYLNRHFVAIKLINVNTQEYLTQVYFQRYTGDWWTDNPWVSLPGPIFLNRRLPSIDCAPRCDPYEPTIFICGAVDVQTDDKERLTRIVHGQTVYFQGNFFKLA